MLTKQNLHQIEEIVDRKLDEKLSKLVTKEELKEELDERLSQLVTKEKLDERLSQFPTKDVLYTMLDEIYKAVTANSQESSSMNFRLQDHEERISLLEKIASSFTTT